MENISWSDERVLSVVNNYEKAMEELRYKLPEFKMIDVLKFFLYKYAQNNDNKDVDSVFPKKYSEVKIDNTALNDIIRQIFDSTLGTIPLAAKESYIRVVLKKLDDFFKFDDNITSVFSSYKNEYICGENNHYFVKGFNSFMTLIEEAFSFKDKIDVSFDNYSDACIFNLFYGDEMVENDNVYIVCLNHSSLNERNKYDYYFDENMDFNHIDSIMSNLTPSGKIITGVSQHIINGKNLHVQRLLDNHMVRKVCLNDLGKGWMEIGFPSQHDIEVEFYKSEEGIIRHVGCEKITRHHYSLDIDRYDISEKVDEFIHILTSLRNSFEDGLHYDECMASLFLIPYFKMKYKDELFTYIYDFSRYDDLGKRLENQPDEFLKKQIARAFRYCVSTMSNQAVVTDTKCQQFFNAIRLIDSIDNKAFSKYYPEIIESISNAIIRPQYVSQYEFIKSLLGNTEKLNFVIRKDDSADILFPGDGKIEDQTSFSGWGSILSPKMLKLQNVGVEMAFNTCEYEGNASVGYFACGGMDPICSVAQYIVFDALKGKSSTAGVWDVNSRMHGDTDVFIDLHRDIRQFENLAISHLNPDGQYVTFAMKNKMPECQPVIEQLIKKNVVDKIVSLNNRYLFFLSLNKHDDKVVLAKFNHVDDKRWLETYPSIIEEMSLQKDSRHVRILSVENFANNNYSLSTNHYFTLEEVTDMEGIIGSIVYRRRDNYAPIDVLLNILKRISFLYAQGGDVPNIDSLDVKDLGVIFDNLQEYEEILMDHYAECVDTIVNFFALEDASFAFPYPEVASLMVALHDSNNVRKLYNPFAGWATFATLLPNCNYVGNEINPIRYALGELRINAQGLGHKGFYCDDPVQFIKSLPVDEKYDTILSIPPFIPTENVDVYSFLFEDCMSHLEEFGKMTFVFPMGFTFNRSPKMREIRKKLVDNNLVEKVIALPKGSFQGTNVGTCLIQLSKQSNQKIVFCDATQMVDHYKNKTVIRVDEIVSAIRNMKEDYCYGVSCSDIADNNYSLNPIAYKPLPAQDGMSTFKLGDLLTPVQHEKCSEERGLVFTPDHLSSDIVDYRRTFSDLKKEILNDTMLKVQGDALLLSSIQGSLKPTYLEIDKDICYHVNHNILVFKVDTSKVWPAYLCYALTQPEVLHQIDNYRTSTIAFINSDDLLNIRINLSNLNAQRNTIEELARLRYAEMKQKASKLFGPAYTEKEEEFKSLRHAMRPSVAGISSAVDILYNYFEKTGQLETVVHGRRGSTLADKLSVIKDEIHFISTLIKQSTDYLDFSKYPLTSVPISEILDHVNYETEVFSISKSKTLADTMGEITVKMNLDLFKILINLIMSNAETHAFSNSNPTNNVRIEALCDNNNFTMFVSNNGKPFPKDVDINSIKKRYWSAGEHRGSGIGGNDIHKIMTVFQGEFKLIVDYQDSYPTCYVLRFPIE